MRRNVAKWLTPFGTGVGLALVITGLILGLAASKSEVKKITAEMATLRANIKAQGDFIARLQMQIEDINAQTTWIFSKLDKRRVLIPVMGGRAYKLVEIENETRTEPPDRQLPGE